MKWAYCQWSRHTSIFKIPRSLFDILSDFDQLKLSSILTAIVGRLTNNIYDPG
jgi:hypothetical protein